MLSDFEVVDLFAGPGGWDVAAHRLGLDPMGIEFDKAACETRRAAGLATIEGDVRDYGPADFPLARGLIASPPCQTFSMAGKGAGRKALDQVLELVANMAVGIRPVVEALDDERTGLVLEPLRWALDALAPGRHFKWLAFEQVPTVLPVWQAMAEVLRGAGYRVETGLLHAEQFGVPQTRTAAWIHERPATTIVGSFKPEIVAAPGYRTTVSRQNAPDSVRVTVQEAAILQSFPADHPWQGSKTKQYQQVGNAIPPLLAEAILRSVLTPLH